MYPTSANYPAAVRAGGRQTVVVDAWYDGAPVAGAQGLLLAGDSPGSITDTSVPGVRRQLDVELIPQPGLFDLLAPNGTQLKVRSVLRYNNGRTESVPMGVFEVDSSSLDYASSGGLQVSASDKWALIQRARFLTPYASTPGLRVVDEISKLVHEGLEATERVVIKATSGALVGSHVWDRDRDKAIIELAESIGAWCYFDRDGVFTIDNLPRLHGAAPVWSVDASTTGVMLSASRSRDRAKTYNVVVARGESTDDAQAFPPQIVWDDDPNSPTYAGTNPSNGANVGPFGVVPYHYSSPLLVTQLQALEAARTILARVTGLNTQLSVTAVRNHALDALDVLQVLLPRERYDLPRPVEIHVADKVVHPLGPSGTQRIETRATRTDEV